MATYIRNSWNNRAPLIEASDVAATREQSAGRVGPWTLMELRPFDPPELRRNWKLTASHGNDKTGQAVDGNHGSRWDTGTPQVPGMWFTIELPEPVHVASLTLDTKGSDMDYPRGYLVQTSSDAESWSEPVAEGRGDNPITTIELSIPEPTRFLKITQTGQVGNKYWSIHELSLRGLTGNEPKVQSLAETLSEEDPGQLAATARDTGNATRGAALFYSPAISCAKCHDPAQGKRLGPDLASKRDGVSDTYLIESILQPSKVIRKGFEQISVVTDEGLVITGYRLEDKEGHVVLREPAAGREISIDPETIEETVPSKVSAMPNGLVNQLGSREQFLDIARFLIEIHEGGPSRLQQLKKAAASH